jgi:hypothetical protein
MRKVTGRLVIGMMLFVSMLPAQSNTRRHSAEREKKPSTSFVVRNQNAVRSAGEPMNEEKLATRPMQASAPNAPTVCRHDDLNRDMEFRLCMNQLLDSAEGLHRTRRSQAAD